MMMIAAAAEKAAAEKVACWKVLKPVFASILFTFVCRSPYGRAVKWVAIYAGSNKEYLNVHRYGYASQGKAAWKLDYTKAFLPAYKGRLVCITFKPMNTYEEVLDEVVVSDVKAKFKLTQRNQVPPTALNEKKTSGLDTTEKPWQLSEYELKRAKTIEYNKRMQESLGLCNMIDMNPRKSLKRIDSEQVHRNSEQGPRKSARLRGADEREGNNDRQTSTSWQISRQRRHKKQTP